MWSASNVDPVDDLLDAFDVLGDLDGELALRFGTDFTVQRHGAPVRIDVDVRRLHAALESQRDLDRRSDRGVTDRIADGASLSWLWGLMRTVERDHSDERQNCEKDAQTVIHLFYTSFLEHFLQINKVC